MKAEKVYHVLNALSIHYETLQHIAVFTVEEMKKAVPDLDAQGCKNLFLRDNKGKQHFLVVMPEDKPFNLKSFGDTHAIGKLSFASEKRLIKYLDLTPGSVSPFGLINDAENHVIVFVDSDLIKADKVSFHPNDNTASVVLASSDFKLFMDSLDNLVNWVHI